VAPLRAERVTLFGAGPCGRRAADGHLDSIRAEDSRQRSWLADVPDVPLAELVDWFGRAQGPVRAGQRGRLHRLRSGTPGEPPAGDYAIEISRLSAVLANEIGQLIKNVGADRVVFGTGMPFNYPDPSLVKMEVLDAGEADKERIRWKNAAG